jgi:hypothetical protein
MKSPRLGMREQPRRSCCGVRVASTDSLVRSADTEKTRAPRHVGRLGLTTNPSEQALRPAG